MYDSVNNNISYLRKGGWFMVFNTRTDNTHGQKIKANKDQQCSTKHCKKLKIRKHESHYKQG
jgi:hypothetical protein